MSDYTEFAELGETGFKETAPVAPEDEFFHSLYISGKTRKNHIDVEEIAGKFQIRGVEYNLEKVSMIITHVKKVLVKLKKVGIKETIDCFSFKESPNPPWYGYNKRECPTTSVERSENSFCKDCKEQIVVGGIYCKEDGTVVTKDGKPIFMFFRAKGTKYYNCSQYLGELYKMDLDPIFEPVSEKSKEFEKIAVNNKRFITIITKGEADTKHGTKDVFNFSVGLKLSKDAVLNILRISKETKDKFNKKIDWSKEGNATDFAPTNSISQENLIPETDGPSHSKPEQTTVKPSFNFEDISF